MQQQQQLQLQQGNHTLQELFRREKHRLAAQEKHLLDQYSPTASPTASPGASPMTPPCTLSPVAPYCPPLGRAYSPPLGRACDPGSTGLRTHGGRRNVRNMRNVRNDNRRIPQHQNVIPLVLTCPPPPPPSYPYHLFPKPLPVAPRAQDTIEQIRACLPDGSDMGIGWTSSTVP